VSSLPDFVAARFTIAMTRCALCALLIGAVGCGSSTPKDTRFPPRAEGCEVQIYVDAPSVATENIGTVSATCGETISNADCMRTLKDEACKLGADVLWGVDDTAVQSVTKRRISGRAAHTKTGK
jgi:hypothetical protein